ncbi:MAG: tRNA lysidine(34) synthetase TilS [Gammaproteobacteria bacterium]|nr:tRNA lysidine(34) synthetase TilS [Gammaproteobacteria bacterium]
MNSSADYIAELLFKELRLSPQTCFYVAYSGGLDSTVLLHLMQQVQQQYGFELTALHANHGLQADSARWAEHCEVLCADMGVAFQRADLRLADSSEATARNARYQWFRQQMDPQSVLLTAHHRQDRSETLLFNLMRGAGSRGLSSLRRTRPFQGAKIVRPMLDFSREQVKQYAIQQSLHWVEDPSNQCDEYSRNHIRQHVLPSLTGFRADAIENIARAAANLEQEHGLLNEIAISDLVNVREMPQHPLDQSHALCFADLLNLSPARQGNLVRFWLHSLQLHSPSKRFLQQLLESINGEPASTSVLQEEGCQFRFYRGYMYVMPPMTDLKPMATVNWRDIDQPIDLYEEKLRVDATQQLRELLASRQTASVRLASRPNLSNPKALQGHSLNLKKWLQEIGIPPWRRQALPILTLNQADADVVLGPVDQHMQSDWVSLECPLN